MNEFDRYQEFILQNMLIMKKPLSEITTLEDWIANIGVIKMNEKEDPEFDIRINATELGKLHHILCMLESMIKRPKIPPEDMPWVSELGLKLVHDWRETLDTKLKAR